MQRYRTNGSNENAILNAIRRRGEISRVDIARLTGITAPTVTNVTGKLLRMGLISEYDVADSSGGRRPVLLKIIPDTARLLIVNIRSKEVLGYIVDASCDVKKQVSRDIGKLDRDEVLNELFAVVSELLKSARANPVHAIGVIVRGPVKSREGISLFSPRIGWRNMPIRHLLEEQFKLPVFVENDMRAMALGEYRFGRYKDVSSLIFLGVGGGIGSGIILNNELYRGQNDSAGEIGHTVVDPHGPLCSCGNNGCLEALASETAIVSAVTAAVADGRSSVVSDMISGEPDALRPEHVYDAAASGDKLACEVLGNAARFLGIGAANVINTFNPEILMIGGGIVKVRKIIEPALQREVKQRALESCYSTVRVEFSSAGREAALKGIADIAFSEIM